MALRGLLLVPLRTYAECVDEAILLHVAGATLRFPPFSIGWLCFWYGLLALALVWRTQRLPAVAPTRG